MLQNAYFLVKIGADTAENEQHFAENNSKYAFCSIFQNLPDSQAEIFEI